jgi:hypothetical protein
MAWGSFSRIDIMAKVTRLIQARQIIYDISQQNKVSEKPTLYEIFWQFLALADNAYFAQHATFPGVSGNLTAPGTPWILYGGSLAGGETAFSIKTYGDVLFGGIASSAPTKLALEYPEWWKIFCLPILASILNCFGYNPIQKYGPQDCVASINAIVEKIDTLVASGDDEAITQLKTIFGLESLTDIRDFAQTISFPHGY